MFAIMILLKREDLRDRVLRLAGARDLHRTTAAMNEAAERVSRYLLMQLGVGICYGLPVGIGLAVIGIPNALLWGMLGVVLRFIPYIGGPLTAVLPVALAIAVAPGWGLLLWTILLFAAVELVIANIVEPLGLQPQHRPVGGGGGRGGGVLDLAVGHCRVVAGDAADRVPGGARAVCAAAAIPRHPARQPAGAVAAGNPVPAPACPRSGRSGRAGRGIRPRQIDRRVFRRCRDPGAGAGAGRQRPRRARRRTAAPRSPRALPRCSTTSPRTGCRAAASRARDGAPVVCLAGRNELDLAAAWLLQHLLRLRGHRCPVYRRTR